MRKVVSGGVRIPFTKWRVRRYQYVEDVEFQRSGMKIPVDLTEWDE